ncbi:MAG: hypothetical protein SF028_15570 [Candidatus Sumerlaeia bacterium]|nr:hypothetical protein [Candidatus Sumerlaeia bacterium]
MPDRAYLVASNDPEAYPSWREPFSSKEQLIAKQSYSVPSLWFALFRPGDMKTLTLREGDNEETRMAPVATVEDALANLRASGEVICAMNPGFDFGGYAELLAEAVESSGMKYITIEFEEIEGLCEDPIRYRMEVMEALRTLAGEVPPMDREKHLAQQAKNQNNGARDVGDMEPEPQATVLFIGLYEEDTLPPADVVRTQGLDGLSDGQCRCFGDAIGASCWRDTPWDKRG